MAEEAYIGEIMMWAGGYAPRGWAYCNGQLLSIAQNQALFALLGTTYGGNGQTTFALPDLRGRVPRGCQYTGYSDLGNGGSASTALTPVSVAAPDPEAADNVSVVAAPQGGTVENLPPYQNLTFVICLWGIWPCRD